MLNKKIIATGLVLAVFAIPTISHANNTKAINATDIIQEGEFNISEYKKELKNELKILIEDVKNDEELTKKFNVIYKDIDLIQTEKDLNIFFEKLSDLYSKSFEDIDSEQILDTHNINIDDFIKDAEKWISEEVAKGENLKAELEEIKKLSKNKELLKDSEKAFEELNKIEEKVSKYFNEKYEKEYFKENKENFPKWIDEDIKWIKEEAKNSKVNLDEEIKKLEELKNESSKVKNHNELNKLLEKEEKIIKSISEKIHKNSGKYNEVFGYNIDIPVNGIEGINSDVINGTNTMIDFTNGTNVFDEKEYFENVKKELPEYVTSDINYLKEEAKNSKVNLDVEINGLEKIKKAIKYIKKAEDLESFYEAQNKIIEAAFKKINNA